jgi:molybdenum cofactor biosynthesis enzyme MoaA
MLVFQKSIGLLKMFEKTTIPTYARIILTTQCLNKCPYCHNEGSKGKNNSEYEYTKEQLKNFIEFLIKNNFRKFKFLGGEPFLSRDFSEIIKFINTFDLDLDISTITSCVFPTKAYYEALDAGLKRINVSIHGFLYDAFKIRNTSYRSYLLRNENLKIILDNSPMKVKLNYVYSGISDEKDLSEFLKWAGNRKLFVSVLDNLNMDYSWLDILKVVTRLYKKGYDLIENIDQNCLPTLLVNFSDGFKLEIKNKRISNYNFFRSCTTCGYKDTCKEGIFAMRLDKYGNLQPCLARDDNKFPLNKYLIQFGEIETQNRFNGYIKNI